VPPRSGTQKIRVEARWRSRAAGRGIKWPFLAALSFSRHLYADRKLSVIVMTLPASLTAKLSVPRPIRLPIERG
jgi:hypothetical protein